MAVNANSMAWGDSEPQGIAAKVFGNTLHSNTLESSAGAIEAISPYNTCSYHPNRLPVEIFGISLKADLNEYPNSPVPSYWPQSVSLWSTLPQGITLPMAWTDCSLGGTDWQMTRCVEGSLG